MGGIHFCDERTATDLLYFWAYITHALILDAVKTIWSAETKMKRPSIHVNHTEQKKQLQSINQNKLVKNKELTLLF